MASKRKKSGTQSKSLRTPRYERPTRVSSAAKKSEQFIFKFSCGDVPGEPVGCVIDVVAPSPGAALARARDVIDSMQMGITVTDQAIWPPNGAMDDMDVDAEYARVYFGRPSDLTLDHVTMVSEVGGRDVDVLSGDLTPRTSVRRLIDGVTGGAARRA